MRQLSHLLFIALQVDGLLPERRGRNRHCKNNRILLDYSIGDALKESFKES